MCACKTEPECARECVSVGMDVCVCMSDILTRISRAINFILPSLYLCQKIAQV